MMKLQVGLAILIFFAACKDPVEHQAAGKKGIAWEGVMKIYKPVEADTIKVFPAEDPDSTGYLYKGEKMDILNIDLLLQNILANDLDDIYAISRFNIDSNRIGLITRLPSQYNSASIALLIFNRAEDRITDHFELADQFEDEKRAYIKTGWIFMDKNKQYKFLIHQQYKNFIPGKPETTAFTTDRYVLIGLNKAVHDTISRNAKPYFIKLQNYK